MPFKVFFIAEFSFTLDPTPLTLIFDEIRLFLIHFLEIKYGKKFSDSYYYEKSMFFGYFLSQKYFIFALLGRTVDASLLLNIYGVCVPNGFWAGKTFVRRRVI